MKTLSHAKLVVAVRARAKKEVDTLFSGKPPTPLRFSVPAHETRAQEAFAEARRAVNELLKVASADAVLGPCTQYLTAVAPKLRSIAEEEPWRKGYRWRQHSGARTSAIAIAVDMFGGSMVNGKPRFSDTELAYIALTWNAPVQGTSVGDCARLTAEAIRADRNRRNRG